MPPALVPSSIVPSNMPMTYTLPAVSTATEVARSFDVPPIRFDQRCAPAPE
jgi:hypothetical protein